MVGMWDLIMSWLKYAQVLMMPAVVARTVVPVAEPYVIDKLIPQYKSAGEVVVIGLQAKRE